MHINSCFVCNELLYTLRTGMGKVRSSGEKMYAHECGQAPLLRFPALLRKNHKQSICYIELMLALPTSFIIWRAYGLKRMVGYLIGFTMATAAQRAFLSAMMRKIGQEHVSLADVLSLSRAGIGAVLAGLV